MDRRKFAQISMAALGWLLGRQAAPKEQVVAESLPAPEQHVANTPTDRVWDRNDPPPDKMGCRAVVDCRDRVATFYFDSMGRLDCVRVNNEEVMVRGEPKLSLDRIDREGDEVVLRFRPDAKAAQLTPYEQGRLLRYNEALASDEVIPFQPIRPIRSPV